MERVTGLGGIFFKARDPKALGAWYKKHLGLPISDEWNGMEFHWREKENPDHTGYTVWSPFREDTKYFEPSKSSFMVNFRVSDLDAVLEALRKEGVWVDDKVEEYEYGRFGWIMDYEGNKVELWEPK